MAKKMLIDLQRCVGCWTCAMACKVGNGLEDDDYRIIVRTNGSGAGIDRPQGIYPSLKMSWQPIYQKSCTFCAQNVAEGDPQYCVQDCPTNALAWGDDEDPEGAYCQAVQRCLDLHYHLFEIPAREGTRANVTYAVRE
ncbi:MAG: hypothetical protein IKE20_06870 [Eggerthellaceae bacterium]|nr:hypothetical protein [Eggerthellaceae bacterium]